MMRRSRKDLPVPALPVKKRDTPERARSYTACCSGASGSSLPEDELLELLLLELLALRLSGSDEAESDLLLAALGSADDGRQPGETSAPIVELVLLLTLTWLASEDTAVMDKATLLALNFAVVSVSDV